MPKFDTKSDFDIFSVIKDEDLNAESSIIKNQIESDVKSLLIELPEDQRQVLEMRIYNEYSFKEIAYKTDVSINTALGRMRYALINLRKIIEERNIILTEK
jgi:RNA polymerase sigma-70 factor (ECF subfamily)